MRGFASLFLALLLAACTVSVTKPASAPPAIDASALVAGQGLDPQSSALLILRLSDGQIWVSNSQRAQKRFIPASSSKIPHTLIALEQGIAHKERPFQWDGTQRSFAQWNQDQTLATAYKRSAVWVYQQLAREMGPEILGAGLRDFDYGNAQIGGPEDLTTYWLRGPLEISAQEQVSFLTRFIKGELALKQQTYDAAREIFLTETGADHQIFAKSGWMSDPDATDIGWYVGWAQSGAQTYVFALNLDMEDAALIPKRASAVRAALIEIGAIKQP